MAYKKISVSDAPRKPRTVVPRFAKTDEWQLMKADLDRGLKPNEALVIALSEEDKQKYAIKNRRTVARFVRAYLTSHKLPYKMKSFHRDGADFVIVQCVPDPRRS